MKFACKFHLSSQNVDNRENCFRDLPGAACRCSFEPRVSLDGIKSDRRAQNERISSPDAAAFMMRETFSHFRNILIGANRASTVTTDIKICM